MKHFAPQLNAVQDFVSKKIGSFTETISTRPAYFGSSAFIDLIHLLQLEITNADISLAAPLSYDTEINKGDVFVSDMFNLYKYENMLYTYKELVEAIDELGASGAIFNPLGISYYIPLETLKKIEKDFNK